ncbi:hypothetical protein [Citrobacter enshiensis]|uniref:hypothetical protein n=1 Tax=Citrobacter enshiensis TaxID=2971264 RepID=UPI0023E88020|nr:hypothetical protein [Citrobacter enshiensis]WET42503.1 hypothetical protein P2W74_10925 [Citrobacter enshiensis]
MPVLKTSLKWSPDGCRIEVIPAGEHPELPGRALEIASQLGILDVGYLPPDPQQDPEKTDKKAKK